MKKSLLTIWCVLVLSVQVVGEDIDPPPYRESWKSTTQEWDFLTPTPGLPYPPDGTSGITNNPFGTAEIMSLTGEYLFDTGPGPGGAWELTDIMINTIAMEPGIVLPYPGPSDTFVFYRSDSDRGLHVCSAVGIAGSWKYSSDQTETNYFVRDFSQEY